MDDSLAIFDLDSTLLDGDCELVWCDALLKNGFVDEPFMQQINQYCQDYEFGSLDYVEFEKFLLSPITSFSVQRIQQLLDDYLVQIHALFRPYMMWRLESHRSDGNELILATASNSFLAKPVADLLRIPNLVCTTAEMIGGKPTGNVLGKPAFREGKVERVKEWITGQNASLAGSWGYSDSHNDIPILNLVEHPVAVGPDDLLRRHAVENGWAIIEKSKFASRNL